MRNPFLALIVAQQALAMDAKEYENAVRYIGDRIGTLQSEPGALAGFVNLPENTDPTRVALLAIDKFTDQMKDLAKQYRAIHTVVNDPFTTPPYETLTSVQNTAHRLAYRAEELHGVLMETAGQLQQEHAIVDDVLLSGDSVTDAEKMINNNLVDEEVGRIIYLKDVTATLKRSVIVEEEGENYSLEEDKYLVFVNNDEYDSTDSMSSAIRIVQDMMEDDSDVDEQDVHIEHRVVKYPEVKMTITNDLDIVSVNDGGGIW